MKKQKIIKAGVLTAVFIIAVVGFSFLTNRDQASYTADMSNATLPRVYFQQEGYNVNSLMAYKEKMDAGTMYDGVVPLDIGGQLQMGIDTDGDEVESITYQVYSMDGKESLLKGDAQVVDNEKAELDVNRGVATGTEAIVEICLKTKDIGKVYYYTRVTRSEGMYLKNAIDYVTDVHNQTFEKEENSLNTCIEPSAEGDNTTFQHVTIHSTVDQVTWGRLNPIVNGAIETSIREANTTYQEIQMKYQVFCEGDGNEKELYNIVEFFRVRYDKGLKKVYLLAYDRTMDQVIEGTKDVLGSRGIMLGIRDTNVDYVANEEGTVLSFVQERELWSYNEGADELSQVFSFGNAENNDIRNCYDQHKIRILSVDDNGSTTFVVYGYMNRGEHEGYVGAAIYYFDIEKNSVTEKAFIPSRKSFTIAEEELGKLLYYSKDRNMLYVLAAGTFYKVDLENNKQTEIAASLEDGEYVASDDGELLAYQTKDKDDKVTGVTVLNFSSGKSYDVTAEDGEVLNPLGFVDTDFLYGCAKDSDEGKDVTGAQITPMYKLVICNSKKDKMTYQEDGIYVQSVTIADKMITMERVTKSGDTYTTTTQDYITNNVEAKTSSINVETYTTELKEKQVRLTYTEGIKDLKPKLLQPKLVKNKEAMEISYKEDKEKEEEYYVYINGRLAKTVNKAYAAIALADQEYGTVVNQNQQRIWQRGNRDLSYTIDNVSAYQSALQSGTSAVDIMKNTFGDQTIDLAGCKTEQVFYLVNQAVPVAAMIGQDQWVLIIGYTDSKVVYLDAAGQQQTMAITEMDAAVSSFGNAFIGG